MARRYSGVPVTPFQDFCSRVDDLSDTDLAYNLRKWEPSHEINLALNQLYNANSYLRSQYGTSGPLKPWNSAPSPHQRHAHLHAHTRPSSPYTPPRTPVSDAASLQLEQQLSEVNSKLAQCNKLIASQQSELGSQRATLAAANKTIQEQEATIAGNTSTIKSLRQRLAEQYFAAGRDRDATEQYTKLEEMQKVEANQRRSWHDRSGARAAEARELEATVAKGRAQLREGRYTDAEKSFRHVLRRRKDLFVDEEVRQAETREAQLLLCETLTKSGSTDKIHEAEGIYLRSEPLIGLEGMSDTDKEWALTNILALAHSYADQKSYRLAITKLSDVWHWRSTTSRTFRTTIISTAYKIITLCEKRHQPAYAAKAFDIMHPDRTTPLTGESLATASRLGVSLFNTGSHDDKSLAYLKQAWLQRRFLDSSAVRTIGWTLAMLRAHSARWADVRDLLMDLPSSSSSSSRQRHSRTPSPVVQHPPKDSMAAPAPQDSDPTDDALLSLLAHAQLHLGDLAGAIQNARALYAKHGASSISVGFRWGHVDTLIRALALAQRREDEGVLKAAGAGAGGKGKVDARLGASASSRFFEAREVWRRVYADSLMVLSEEGKVVGVGEARKREGEVRRHAEAGLVLAGEWRASAVARGKVPRSAEVVRVEAEGLLARCR